MSNSEVQLNNSCIRHARTYSYSLNPYASYSAPRFSCCCSPHTSAYSSTTAIPCYHCGEMGDSCAPSVAWKDFTAEREKTTGLISEETPSAPPLTISLSISTFYLPCSPIRHLHKTPKTWGLCQQKRQRHQLRVLVFRRLASRIAEIWGKETLTE